MHSSCVLTSDENVALLVRLIHQSLWWNSQPFNMPYIHHFQSPTYPESKDFPIFSADEVENAFSSPDPLQMTPKLVSSISSIDKYPGSLLLPLLLLFQVCPVCGWTCSSCMPRFSKKNAQKCGHFH